MEKNCSDSFFNLYQVEIYENDTIFPFCIFEKKYDSLFMLRML